MAGNLRLTIEVDPVQLYGLSAPVQTSLLLTVLARSLALPELAPSLVTESKLYSHIIELPAPSTSKQARSMYGRAEGSARPPSKARAESGRRISAVDRAAAQSSLPPSSLIETLGKLHRRSNDLGRKLSRLSELLRFPHRRSLADARPVLNAEVEDDLLNRFVDTSNTPVKLVRGIVDRKLPLNLLEGERFELRELREVSEAVDLFRQGGCGEVRILGHDSLHGLAASGGGFGSSGVGAGEESRKERGEADVV